MKQTASWNQTQGILVGLALSRGGTLHGGLGWTRVDAAGVCEPKTESTRACRRLLIYSSLYKACEPASAQPNPIDIIITLSHQTSRCDGSYYWAAIELE